MNDFLTEALAGNDVVSREISISGKVGTIYLKRLTAGQREEMLKGSKITHQLGSEGEKSTNTVEIDLCANERQRQLLVLYTVCNQDGSPRFDKLAAVKSSPSHVIDKLAAASEELQREQEEAENPVKP